MTATNYDTETVTVHNGCIAQETTDATDVWVQIGANEAVATTLNHVCEIETNQRFSN